MMRNRIEAAAFLLLVAVQSAEETVMTIEELPSGETAQAASLPEPGESHLFNPDAEPSWLAWGTAQDAILWPMRLFPNLPLA